MNIPQIVQMIATAVNSKMALTLSRRVQQLSERVSGGNNGGNGFFSRVASRGIGRTIQSTEEKRDKAAGIGRALERTEAKRDRTGDAFYKSLHESFVAKANQESAATIRKLTNRTVRLKDAFDDLTAAAEKLKKDYQETLRIETAAEKRHHQNPTQNINGNGFFSRVASRGIGRTIQSTEEKRDKAAGIGRALERTEEKRDKAAGIGRALERTEEKRDKAGDAFYKSLHESFVAKANQESPSVIHSMTERTLRLKDAFDDLTAAAEKLKKDYQEKTRAEQAAEKRHPQTAMKKLWRQAKVQVKRRIGKRGRQSIKRIRDSLDPQKAKLRADAARSVYRQAQESHQISEKVLKTSQSKYDDAKAQHKTNPTSSTAKNLVNASQGLDAAAVAEKTAKAGMAVARSAMGMAVATEAAALSIPVVGEALLGLQLAFATAASAFGAAASFVVSQSQAMQSEVERFRKERSTYNGVIANAVARYDRQSIQLEARSSMASQNSAKGVVESGMALRESTQGRSERWENLSNHAMTFFNDMATTVSRAIDFFDFIPRIGTEMFDALRILVEYASFGNIVMTKIERNTKQEDPIGIDAFKGFFKGVTDKKPPKDLKPVK